MTFEEYKTSEHFRKSLRRLRLVKKMRKWSVWMAAVFVVLSLAMVALFHFTDESQTKTAWFMACAVTLAVLFAASVIGWIAVGISAGDASDEENDWNILQVGLYLYIRDLGIDWQQFCVNGVLDVPIYLPASKLRERYCTTASVGDVTLDFSPWEGISYPSVGYCVAAGLSAFLSSPPPSLVSAGAHVETDGTQLNYKGKRLWWIKSGRWTFSGKQMLRKVRRVEKALSKLK